MLILDKSQFDSKIDKQRLNLLIGRIKNIKNTFELIEGVHYRDSRFEDDSRIAYMIIGDIVEETRNEDGSHNYEAANSKFISMNTSEIHPYIERAVLDSAGADFYYKFEKDWGYDD